MLIDAAFPIEVRGEIPSDHGYSLYAAMSRVVPAIHDNNGIGIHPLSPNTLKVRAELHQLAILRDIVGCRFVIERCSLVVLDRPAVRELHPSLSLTSRLVTTKNGIDRERFADEVRRQLMALGAVNSRESIGVRMVLRIKNKIVVGYAMTIEAATAEESLAIQSAGVGGRRHMGCGVFVPC